MRVDLWLEGEGELAGVAAGGGAGFKDGGGALDEKRIADQLDIRGCGLEPSFHRDGSTLGGNVQRYGGA